MKFSTSDKGESQENPIIVEPISIEPLSTMSSTTLVLFGVPSANKAKIKGLLALSKKIRMSSQVLPRLLFRHPLRHRSAKFHQSLDLHPFQ